MKSLAAISASLLALPALAHDGHGLLGSHWHPTDVLGFVAAGGAVALLVWFSGRGK
ncbi:hypothetical protein [Hydrogenophaga sp. PAMC20947]|uniref:hypothetical protein n=1 Tax=Hydrogenophaga sp. PAMC20947 TaxID=2565558 RepID=UPI001446B264|nr:hypothetical protein [Hydrogenophaga sp. PAMC20947]